jgi:hypothetical protein
MRRRQGPSTFSIAVVLLVLPACSTEEVAPTTHIIVASEHPGPGMGDLEIYFAPADATYQQEEARILAGGQTEYRIMVDGEYLYQPTVTDLFEETVWRGGACTNAYLPAGPHHFTLVDPDGVRIFEGDGEIPADGTERIFVYGPLDALQGRFVPVPSLPAAGLQHLTAINLTMDGESLEVVTCTDATTCTPVASALALGDVFDGELPPFYNDCLPTNLDVSSGAPRTGCLTSLTTQGAGVGYRVVPSASFPNPPINAIYGAESSPPGGTPNLFLAAPVYLDDQGLAQFIFE